MYWVLRVTFGYFHSIYGVKGENKEYVYEDVNRAIENYNMALQTDCIEYAQLTLGD